MTTFLGCIQVSKLVDCCPIKRWNGSWLQQAMQKVIHVFYAVVPQSRRGPEWQTCLRNRLQKHLYLIGSETDTNMVQVGYRCGCRRLAFPQLCTSHPNLSRLFVLNLYGATLWTHPRLVYFRNQCSVHTLLHCIWMGDADLEHPPRVKDVGLFIDWTAKMRNSA